MKRKIGMRTSDLVLHRKIGRQRKCICGSDMEYTRQYWLCKRQLRFREPSIIQVHIPNKPVFKKGLHL